MKQLRLQPKGDAAEHFVELAEQHGMTPTQYFYYLFNPNSLTTAKDDRHENSI